MRTLQITIWTLFLALVACTGAHDIETALTPADTPEATPALQVKETVEVTVTVPALTPTTEATVAATQVKETVEVTMTVPAVTPTTEATAAATVGVVTATPTPAAGGTTNAFCPEVSRPALLLVNRFRQKYVVVDPLSGQWCDLPFPDPLSPLPEKLEVANGALYYQLFEGDHSIVKRLAPDGTAEALPFMAVNSWYLSFAVSPDGRYIAWSTYEEKPDEPAVIFSDLWVAEIATGQITAHLPDFDSVDDGVRVLDPVRFSDDGSTLFYTRRLDGIGGGPWAFVGRYDNLFSTPTTGGAVTPIFDCAALELFLCIGDFYLVEGQVSTLVYVNHQTHEVVALNGQGETINTLAVEAEYVGFPTMGPTGELVFYSVALAEDGTVEQAALHRVAPPTAPAEVVVSDPNLSSLQRFLDGGRVVVGYFMGLGVGGLAVVDLMTGSVQPLSEWPDAWVVGVLPASGSCLNDSTFVLDVNVPDGTHVAPGASFTKTWRLRNSGTCTWGASYQLNFVSGERMDGPESMSDGTSAIGQTVLPGEEVDISVALTAPQADGTYHGQWQLVAPDGTAFGARPYVEIVVP